MKIETIFRLLIIIAGFFYSITVKSQDTLAFCGTQTTDEQWLKEYQKHPNNYEKTGETLFVALSIHVFDQSDTILFSEAKILNALCVLNENFAPAKIQFFIKGRINFIVDSIYASHNMTEGAQMMALYNVDNTINCYIVDNPSGYCGYSAYAGIFIRKICMTYEQHTWAHEIGHHLSLPHTFGSWYSINYNPNEPASTQIIGEAEMVNGANCDTAGDGFCDTPPDYLGRNRWQCEKNNLSMTKQTDPNGETFYSDGTLIMSYSHCMNRFSDEQNEAMRNNLKGPHELYLYDETEIPPFFDDVEIKLISPIDGQSVINTREGVKLIWETVPNAQFYIVQVNPLFSDYYYLTEYLSFNKIEFELITQDSFLVLSKSGIDSNFILSDNIDYIWRVRAYQGSSSCTSFSDTEQFRVTSPFWKNKRFDWTAFVEIYPNPLSAASDLTIRYILKKKSSIQLTLFDVAGKLLLKENPEWQEEDNFYTLSLPILPSGLYFLNLIKDDQQVTKKIIVIGN